MWKHSCHTINAPEEDNWCDAGAVHLRPTQPAVGLPLTQHLASASLYLAVWNGGIRASMVGREVASVSQVSLRAHSLLNRKCKWKWLRPSCSDSNDSAPTHTPVGQQASVPALS